MALTKIKQCMTKLPFSNRNKIINGNFDIWQRGISQTSSGYGSDDRWSNANIGSTKTHSRQPFAVGELFPDGTVTPRYYTRTVVSSVVGASNYVLKSQKIESVHTLAGKQATLSFYARANATKNISIEFVQRFGTGGSPSTDVEGIGSQKITLTTEWKRYVITVNIPNILGKTLGTDVNDYLQLMLWFDAGSNYNARTVNLGQQSGTFDIARVQLEEGAVATEFEDRSVGEEFDLCLRYYEAIHTIYPLVYQIAGSGVRQSIPFIKRKRVTPTVTIAYIDYALNSYGASVVGIWSGGCTMSWIASTSGATTIMINLGIEAEM